MNYCATSYELLLRLVALALYYLQTTITLSSQFALYYLQTTATLHSQFAVY